MGMYLVVSINFSTTPECCLFDPNVKTTSATYLQLDQQSKNFG